MVNTHWPTTVFEHMVKILNPLYRKTPIRTKHAKSGPPGVLGIWGEWLFIFMDLGSTGNHFQGFGEQARSFGNLGSPAKK